MTPLSLPGGRDVRATFDRAEDRRDDADADTETGGDADADREPTPAPTAQSNANANPIVVACPPHPQHGGTRQNPILRAVSDALTEHEIDCLRIDYGPWDEGRGERADAATAVEWAGDRTDRVGLFGYSFGGAVALQTAAGGDDTAADTVDIASVSAVAPAASLPIGGRSVDAVDAIGDRGPPGQIVYGTRDDTVEWQPVVERARERGFEIVSVEADHFFVGRPRRIADAVSDFFVRTLEDGYDGSGVVDTYDR